MKKFINFIVFASLNFFFWTSPMNAHADELDMKSNYIYIKHTGMQDNPIFPLVILPKTSEAQSDFVLRLTLNGLHEFRIEERFVNEISAFLLTKKDGWGVCPSVSNVGQFGTFEVRWDSVSGNGCLSVTLNDSITMFDRLNEISGPSNNKELNNFLKSMVVRLKSVSEQNRKAD